MTQPIEILLVEDSPTDVLMTREALTYAKVLHNLHVVEDGVAALAFLRRQGQYAAAPRPDLILLDLNLPRKNGLEVLADMKADDALKTIPVVVLTTSQAESDILVSYGLHANCYITKPVDFANFAEVVRSIEQFWFAVVTLPAKVNAMSSDRIRVLLVEDSPTDALLIREALMGRPSAAFAITAVEDLAAARQQLGQAAFEVVLLDLGLPDSQGLATLLTLREHAPRTPIIVLTGLADETLGLHALQAGAQDYLVKGQVAGEGLARAIRYAIERTRAEAENTRLYQLAQAEIAERQRVEAALRESEERLAGIVGSAMDAIISIDAAQCIVVFNTAAEQMFGCSTAAALGQPIEQFIPPLFRGVHAAHIRAFGQTSVTSRSMHSPGVLTALRVDGTEFPIEATISQTVAAGQLLYTVIMRDISARTQAEAALRQSESRFAAAFRASPIAMSITRLSDGRYIDINASHEHLFGYPRDTLIGQSADKINIYADPGQRVEVVRSIRAHGALRETELALRTNSGAIREALCSLETIEVDGEVCILASVFDITARKHAEAALRASEERFRQVFLANPSPKLITRSDTREIIDANPAFARMTGYARDELIGQTTDALGLWPESDLIIQTRSQLSQAGRLTNHEIALRTRDGSSRDLLLSVVSVDIDGVACYLTVMLDQSERKQAEQARRRAAERLQVLADAARAFVEVGTEYQALLDHVARTTATVLGEGCIIRLLSEDKEWLNIVALCDLDAENLELTRSVLGDAPLRVDEPSLTTQIFQSRQPLLIPVVDPSQLRAATKPAYWSAADRLGFHSLLGVPMQVQGQVIGVVIVYRRRSEQSPFNADDLSLAQDLADRAALAIGNARLFQQVQAELAERTSAEVALRESQEDLRLVTETAGIGLALVDADHRYRYTNQTHKTFLRLPTGDLAGQHVADALGALYEQSARQRLERAFAGEFVSEYLDLPVSPGTERHCEVRLKLGAYRTDPVVVVVLIDITDRKRAETALQRSADRLRVLADASRAFAEVGAEYQTLLDQIARTTAERLQAMCTIRLLSDDGQWLDVAALSHYNPALRADMQKDFGGWRIHRDDRAPAAVAVSTGQPQLVPVIDHAAVRAALPPEQQRFLDRFFPHSILSMIVISLPFRGRSIGSLVLARSVSELPAFDADDLRLVEDLGDRAALAISNARLVSQVQYELAERTKAEAEVRALSADLEQRVVARTAELVAANKELEAFSYTISHDLRSPLRAIDGFARILLEDYVAALPDDAQRYFQLMRDNAQQMGRLIDDLLAFSRLSRQPLRKQAVDPAALVRQCLEELQAAQAGRAIEIQIGDLLACQGDPALLKQVWINLLTNALKYSRIREPAMIVIGYRAVGDETIYFVKDNGVGFDMRYSDKLFGVFQRLHRAEEYEGTGVGLAIIQRILHRHGGRIWAEAAVDQGATFFFTLGSGAE